jgi:hypothetical protein
MQRLLNSSPFSPNQCRNHVRENVSDEAHPRFRSVAAFVRTRWAGEPGGASSHARESVLRGIVGAELVATFARTSLGEGARARSRSVVPTRGNYTRGGAARSTSRATSRKGSQTWRKTNDVAMEAAPITCICHPFLKGRQRYLCDLLHPWPNPTTPRPRNTGVTCSSLCSTYVTLLTHSCNIRHPEVRFDLFPPHGHLPNLQSRHAIL